MNYDQLRKDLHTLGFTHKVTDLIIERVSTDTELRQSIEMVQGEDEKDEDIT